MIRWTITVEPCGCVVETGHAESEQEAREVCEAVQRQFFDLVARGEIDLHNGDCPLTRSSA